MPTYKAGGKVVKRQVGGGLDPVNLVGALRPPGGGGGGGLLGPGGEAVNWPKAGVGGGETGNAAFDATFGGVGAPSEEKRQQRINALTTMKSGGKVGKVMHEFKHGQLHSGSKKGPKVKSRDQAIAIGLSEARKAGEKV